ncbi:hypothetical protein SLA_5872 [Streptomyces laurentii]|uniref:Uncharacterized protein n=1 Tax=Streptomyces laurentii TaxID=39478 RepID=A0A160P6V6_STRLU|nr:hypothetical protein SLA_5872 [Streptomyces laurentii]
MDETTFRVQAGDQGKPRMADQSPDGMPTTDPRAGHNLDTSHRDTVVPGDQGRAIFGLPVREPHPAPPEAGTRCLGKTGTAPVPPGRVASCRA